MSDEYVLTLDLGSSAIRAVVVSQDWRIVSEAASPYGTGELGPQILKCLAMAVRDKPLRAISLIAVTAQRGGIAFADDHGKTWDMLANSDTRAVFEGASIDDRLAAEVYSTTGHLPSMFLAPAKLHWFRREHPRLSLRFETIASWGSWAAHELTGEFRETPSTLVEAGLADVTTGRSAVELLAKLEVALDTLPDVVSEGAVVGSLTAEAANATGLAVGTPVTLAGPDTQMATLGAGGLSPGDTVVVAGWSAPVQRVTVAPAFDALRRTWVGRHPLHDHWVAEANPGDTGRTLEMVRDMQNPKMTLAQFDDSAMPARKSIHRHLPIIAAWGPRALNMSNLGLSLGGLITPAPITYDGANASAVAFATLENIAFAIRQCVEWLDEVTGRQDDPLTLAGGMANSAWFPLILAEGTGRAIHVQSPHASAIGAAMVSTLAGDELRAAGADVASRAKVVHPDDVQQVDGATERYDRWLHVLEAMDRLAEEL
jgi:sugar (pentulose or hexulose) kinase